MIQGDPTFASPRLRDRVAGLRYVPFMLQSVWQTHRGYTAAIIALRLARALVPLASLWVAKLVIDAVIAGSKGGATGGRVLALVALEFAIVAIGEALSRLTAIEALLGELFSNRMSARLMEHATRLDLQQFEDPVFYDQLERARQGPQNRVSLLMQMLAFGEGGITLASLSVALTAASPWLFALLALAVMPSFLAETHFADLTHALRAQWTSRQRQLDYIRYAAASNETAKEVRMFGLGPWLVERFQQLSKRFHERNRRLAVRRAGIMSGLALIGTTASYVAVGAIALRAMSGTISIGTMTFLLGGFQRCRSAIQGMLSNLSLVYEQTLYLKDYFELLHTEPRVRSNANARRVPRPIRRGFVFHNVSFKYPGADCWAVRDLTFELLPGERVALVGENGAGKTTVAKLLARLYDPTEGGVLLDGIDLREYELFDVRHAIGVIFQDFVRYDLPFDENIGIGEIEAVRAYFNARENGGEVSETPQPIVVAAEKSLATSVLGRLPGGYRQMLGRRFESGVNLSGGEWQKIALARAYMRDAQVLMLDEPTSALDARAEYDVFSRFKELLQGRIGVLISHRFSTVRMADRILVLQQGRLVEEGCHEQLLDRDGLYAHWFAMQAEGYR